MGNFKTNLVLEFTPRFGNTWVHYDRNYFLENGTEIARFKSSSYAYRPDYPSFQVETIWGYLLSEDKKQYRKENNFFEYPNLAEEQDLVDSYRFVRVPSHGSYVLNKIRIKNPIYICPTTGTPWLPPLSWEDKYSDSFFLFKRLPPKNPFDHLNRNFNKEYRIFGNPYSLNPILPKGAFLPPDAFRQIGRDFVLSSYRAKARFSLIKNPRAFLYEKKKKQPKSFVKKYVRRHFHRILKLGPPTPGQVTLFRSWLGAADLAKLATN